MVGITTIILLDKCLLDMGCVVLPEPGLQPPQQGTGCAGCQASPRRGLHRGLCRGTGPHAAAGWNLPGMTVRLRLCSLLGTHTASSHLGCTCTTDAKLPQASLQVKSVLLNRGYNTLRECNTLHWLFANH